MPKNQRSHVPPTDKLAKNHRLPCPRREHYQSRMLASRIRLVDSRQHLTLVCPELHLRRGYNQFFYNHSYTSLIAQAL